LGGTQARADVLGRFHAENVGGCGSLFDPEEAVSELVRGVDAFEFEVDKIGSKPVQGVVDVDLDIG